MKTRIAPLVGLAIVVSVWNSPGSAGPVLAKEVVQAAGAQTPLVRPNYKTERTWAVQEIAADIDEMTGQNRPLTDAEFILLTPWLPDARLLSFAKQRLGNRANDARDEVVDQHPALLSGSLDELLQANDVVSVTLARRPLSARTHESAALVLAAFALREAASDLTDPRWAMNRMTAHLAVAGALRQTDSSEMSVDGLLASATLEALANRQGTALQIIERLGDVHRDSPTAAWQRILIMRVTDDWRVLKTPATARRLEKREYFRARRVTIPGRLAEQELRDLQEPINQDFRRVVLSHSMSVGDGSAFIVDGVVGELAELAALYQREFHREMRSDFAEIVNQRAGRLMSSGKPRVLPWGAWAEASQRHLAMAVAETDRHYRRTLALPARADELNTRLDKILRPLRLFPIGATSRRIGAAGTEADLSYFDQAVGVLLSAPELVPISYWKSFESTAANNPKVSRVPPAFSWFGVPTVDMPYQAGHRFSQRIGRVSQPVFQTLIELAPFDRWLIWSATNRANTAAIVGRATALVAARTEYDVWAIEQAVAATNDRQQWENHLRRGCELSASLCVTLGSRLQSLDEASAAVAYERAFASVTLDEVNVANSSEWLVFYYERTKQLDKARALAERAAKAGSGRGIRTLARLLERRGDVMAAAPLFQSIETRYPRTGTPSWAAFLYRRAIINKDARYTERWEQVRDRLFPGGLTVDRLITAAPSAGAQLTNESAQSRKGGLEKGDIIVGIDGWHVDTFEQLQTVFEIGDQLAMHRVTLWRGSLLTAGLPATHDLTFVTYVAGGRPQ